MWILISILLLVATAFATLHLFRRPLFSFAIRAQRAKGGLREKRVRIDEHDIVYLEGGNGETLVLLHGFGANKDNWIQIAPLLTPHFRLIIPDLPGFGDSTRDPNKRYDTENQIARLRSFISTLELGDVHLGGNSMGGYLAGLYTASYPDAVKSQWLLAPAGVAAAEPSEFFQCLENDDNPLLVEDMSDFQRLLDMCFTKAPYVPSAFLRCLCERNVAEREFNEKIFAELFSEPRSLEDALKDSSVKTQVVWGDGDRILHPSGASHLAQAIGGAQSIIMQHMGHCPMLERPGETADRYLEFHGIGAT